MSETVADWGEWFDAMGVRPVHARRWPHDDDDHTSSGAVRTDDGAVWGWSRENGAVEAWPVTDDSWDGPELGALPGMREARGEDCVRLLSAEDPWDARASEDAADVRRDDGLRGVFG